MNEEFSSLESQHSFQNFENNLTDFKKFSELENKRIFRKIKFPKFLNLENKKIMKIIKFPKLSNFKNKQIFEFQINLTKFPKFSNLEN